MNPKLFWRMSITAILMILVLAACGGTSEVPEDAGDVSEETGDAAEDPEEISAPEEPFKFGMILVGGKNDSGWSQAHYEGGLFIEENLPGSEMILFENLNPSKPEATLEGVVADMAAEGVTLIFTTSDEFEEDTTKVAADFPDIIFMNISGDDALTGEAPANLGNIMGRMEDMKAIAGCAAALTTQTGSLGYLGPLINFETRRLSASAYLGAQYCYENYRGLDPADLEFTVTWIGFWFNIPGFTLDPTEVANNFFDTGVDVILSGIDTTEGIDVAGQRADGGEAVWSVPYDFESACNSKPGICLGVPYFNWGPSYLLAASTVKVGTWVQAWDWNPPYWANLADNSKTAVGWVNGQGLSADAGTNLDLFIAGLADGSINVWSGPLNLQDGSAFIAAGAVASDNDIWYLPQLLEGMIGSSE